MAKLTVGDLQHMKRDGRKIAAAVVYEFQMARICERAGADITKVDIRQQEEALFDDVLAVMEAGLPVYPQIGFPTGAGSPLHGATADHDHVLKWAHKLADAGAAMLDLTSVTAEIYADVSKSLRIPVLGGQTGPEADGRIYVNYGLVGYHAPNLDQPAKASTAKFMFDIAKKTIDAVHSGRWPRKA